MDSELVRIVEESDEVALEGDFESPHAFLVDWREEDDEIVRLAAQALGLDALGAEWRDEDLIVTFEGRERKAPLLLDVADRHITLCTLNDLLAPRFELRYLVASHGSDTMTIVALGTADWSALESLGPGFVAENFLDPRRLPNIVTELTDDTLPEAARARYRRMCDR